MKSDSIEKEESSRLSRCWHALSRGLLAPIRENALFFVMMYALGVLCAWLTRGKTMYEHLYGELFVDLYVLCAVLLLLPKRVRKWVRGAVAVVLYVVAVVDVYCFHQFGTTLSPSLLMLLTETDSREASEALATYLSPEVLLSPVNRILLLALLHIILALSMKANTLAFLSKQCSKLKNIAALFILIAFIVSLIGCWDNKQKVSKLFGGKDIGDVENTLTASDHGVLYAPIYRLAFSTWSIHLAQKQVDHLVEVSEGARVDSCAFRSPEIVLIIGESYGRHHSALYGYGMPTTPRQQAMEQRGEMVKFSDVVAPWNLTSFVFKLMLSTYTVGKKGSWCDYPLVTQLMRKAGYRVTFLTNQFIPKAKDAVYDFSGGFFLNDSRLDTMQFDVRNKYSYRYDEGLLHAKAKDLDFRDHATDTLLLRPRSFTIYHLLGQHVSYKTRYPRERRRFSHKDYDTFRPELTPQQRVMLSHYDNATLYNDSVVAAICDLYRDREAIVIYMPDHGEECYEGTRGFVCRNHSSTIDYDLAHYEFEVPFWIWGSERYRERHADLWEEIKAAKDRRLMTDALPHLLLYLGGVATPYYDETCNVLSPQYNEKRPRILKATTDYDQLRTH